MRWPPPWMYPWMFWSFGPWWQARSTKSGASGKQIRRMAIRIAAEMIAAGLRRSRRHASPKPPRPPGTATASTVIRRESSLREPHRREELEVGAVEDQPVQVRRDGLRPLPVHERRPAGVVLHEQVVEPRPDRVSGRSERHPLGLVDHLVVGGDVRVRGVVVADV